MLGRNGHPTGGNGAVTHLPGALDLSGDVADLPLKLPAPPAPPVPQPRHIEPVDDHDALADLFLGELRSVAGYDAALGLSPRQAGTNRNGQDQQAHPQPGEPRAPARHAPMVNPARTLEALIIGHLPVTAAAWANQYIRTCSQSGPVGAIRFRAGQLRIDLVESASRTTQPDASSDLHATGALDQLARAATRTVLHGDSQHEAILLACPQITTITLLSSADEAGVVDAYRTLKAITGSPAGSNGALPNRTLRVAILGAPVARARFALDRLRDAARRFLNVSLESAGIIPRIEGGPTARTLFSGPAPLSAALVAARLLAPPTHLHLTPAAGPIPLAAAFPAPEHARQRRAPRAQEPADELALHAAMRGEGSSYPEPALSSDPGSAQSQPDHHLCIPITDESEPATPFTNGVRAGAPAPVAPAPGPRHSTLLAAHLPELLPIAARCPSAPQVELALDESGIIHVLTGALGPNGDPAAVEQLTIVSAWAMIHARLLAQTLPPDRCLRLGEQTVAHLFTGRPAEHRGLLDSTIRVHLLTPVVKSVSADWVCAALN